ncbi:hypothetical protein EI94DRAFT_1197731 [Lactarius quietus]|nr:hypothetical protein EI94DRAFT_1197731 [Lactarius quietus]
MGPRSSISGELPIESYFSSAGRTAGPSGSKGNRTLKRKNAVDASGSDAEWAPTKKHKTKAPSKGSHTRPESNHTRSNELRVSGASRTTSMPTPNSIMKPPPRPSVRIPDDMDVISITSSSPTQMAPLSDRATAHPSSKNTFTDFGLPMPQTVSHGSKTRSRADSASHLHPGRKVDRSSLKRRPDLKPNRRRPYYTFSPYYSAFSAHSTLFPMLCR